MVDFRRLHCENGLPCRRYVNPAICRRYSRLMCTHRTWCKMGLVTWGISSCDLDNTVQGTCRYSDADTVDLHVRSGPNARQGRFIGHCGFMASWIPLPMVRTATPTPDTVDVCVRSGPGARRGSYLVNYCGGCHIKVHAACPMQRLLTHVCVFRTEDEACY